MNERIKKLYEQSFVTDDYVNVGINGVELGIRFDPEKFAELIVRECVNVLDTAHEDARLKSNFDESLLSLLKCFGKGHATYLREHFGVEE